MGTSEVPTDLLDGESRERLATAELVAALRTMSRVLQALLAAQARASGLPLLEFLILIRAAEGDGVIARDVGRELHLNTSTMTGVADRLENEKLVRRALHPKDRRLLLLQATPRGRRAVQRALGPLLRQLSELADTLEDDHRASVASFLNEVSALVVLQAKAASPRPTRRAVARSAASR